MALFCPLHSNPGNLMLTIPPQEISISKDTWSKIVEIFPEHSSEEPLDPSQFDRCSVCTLELSQQERSTEMLKDMRRKLRPVADFFRFGTTPLFCQEANVAIYDLSLEKHPRASLRFAITIYRNRYCIKLSLDSLEFPGIGLEVLHTSLRTVTHSPPRKEL